MIIDGKERIRKISEDLKKGTQVENVSARELVNWFGAARRSRWTNVSIRDALKECGVQTDPDFEHIYIDRFIKFELVNGKSTGSTALADPDSDKNDRDAVHRVGMLEAANTLPITVTKEESVQKAITLMITHDYSQLPVMSGERRVDGMINWPSIFAAQLKNKPAERVIDCMERDIQIVREDASLLSVVKMIIEHEVVLVKALDDKIIGLVTAADIAAQFYELSESFLLLDQIENQLRPLIDEKFSSEELQTAIDPAEETREVKSSDDLTFGEYVRLLENTNNWERLNIKLDRVTFIKRLDEIRRIRNDVMHFHPDGIGEADLKQLREMARFFKTYF